tara:strand:- start:656 stop:1591 length:936 start_codon:yes stop_codon:yes gene_type:complete
MNYFLRIIILTFSIIIFTENITSAKEKVKIVLKIDNEIITNLDIKNEYNYLTALNNDLKKIDKRKGLLLAKQSIIKEKIKKKEIEKFYNLDKENKLFANVIRSFYLQIGLENEDDFKKHLNKYDLNYKDIKEKIKIEAVWNQLIFDRYNELVKIDTEELKKTILKRKGSQNSYLLSEILFKVDLTENMDEKYKNIKKSIAENGFNNSANIYSVSDTAKMGGKIGWVNENQFSKDIAKEIKNLKIGEYSKPIKVGKNYLILKLNNLKKIKNDNLNIDNELKKLINFETNKQLNQMSNIFFNKIKSHTVINEI